MSRGGTSSCRGDYIEIRSALAALYARSTSSSFLKIVFVLTAARANSTSAGRRGMRTLSQTSSAKVGEQRSIFSFCEFFTGFFELFYFLCGSFPGQAKKGRRGSLGLTSDYLHGNAHAIASEAQSGVSLVRNVLCRISCPGLRLSFEQFCRTCLPDFAFCSSPERDEFWSCPPLNSLPVL